MRPLDSTCIDVWTMQVQEHEPSNLEASLPVLSQAERNRYESFRFARHRREYLAAHSLLRHALSQYVALAAAGWTFTSAPNGKPQVSNAEALGNVSFSLSHTAGLVACAISALPQVGIDVEKLDRSVEFLDIAKDSFAPEEYAMLASLLPAQLPGAFCRLWTLKEACGKAIGEGLSAGLRALQFDLRFSPATLVRADDQLPLRWFLHESSPWAGYQMALAVPHARPETIGVRFHDGRDLLPRSQQNPSGAGVV